ncbi:hypothetical protein T492DRAFT_843160 [Pavlovales sp. CCMP2436]|nr:hypothetical protein T492DRAFT_843160 [Pavlovales sp. CCMP2436]
MQHKWPGEVLLALSLPQRTAIRGLVMQGEIDRALLLVGEHYPALFDLAPQRTTPELSPRFSPGFSPGFSPVITGSPVASVLSPGLSPIPPGLSPIPPGLSPITPGKSGRERDSGSGRESVGGHEPGRESERGMESRRESPVGRRRFEHLEMEIDGESLLGGGLLPDFVIIDK